MPQEKITLTFPYSDANIHSCMIPRNRLQQIYRMNEVEPVADLGEAVSDALEHPIGSPSIRQIVSNNSTVVLIVDDVTRPTPAAEILPFIIEELLQAGIDKQQISIVLAIGSHRKMNQKEVESKLGKDVARNYQVINSRFWDPEHLVHVGDSNDGVAIYIEEAVAKAKVKIGIGSIVPHAAVGWSGGGKIIYPGVAGKETVAQFHFTHGLTEQNMTGKEECVVRDRMESWVDIVGLQFIVNCVLTPNNQVYKVVAGHYRKAHRYGVSFAKEVYSRKIGTQSDIVIAVSYSHDIDFWQATKGIYSAEPLVRDGGTLLLVTPCYEGLGLHTEFPACIGDDNTRVILRQVLEGTLPSPHDPLPIPPGAMLARLRHRIHCAVVSPGLTDQSIRQAKYEPFPNVQTAVDKLLERYPKGKVSVVMRSDLTFQP